MIVYIESLHDFGMLCECTCGGVHTWIASSISIFEKAASIVKKLWHIKRERMRQVEIQQQRKWRRKNERQPIKSC